jgi:hypothetical protein
MLPFIKCLSRLRKEQEKMVRLLLLVHALARRAKAINWSEHRGSVNTAHNVLIARFTEAPNHARDKNSRRSIGPLAIPNHQSFLQEQVWSPIHFWSKS